MAAMLIEIKSRMLLPPKKTDDGREPEDPRAELVRRLIEYEQMKQAAARLDALPVIGRDFLRAQVAIEQALALRLPDVDAGELRAAWADILGRARLTEHHTITREHLSVREYMSQVLKRLQGALRAVRRPVRREPRPAGAGRDLHRDAGTLTRASARCHAGRGVRADLRAAGLHTNLIGHTSRGRQHPKRRPCYFTSRLKPSASNRSVVCASCGTQSEEGSSRERADNFSIAFQSSAI